MRVYQTLLNTFLTLDTILPLGEDNLSPLGTAINVIISEKNNLLWSMVSRNGTSGILATVEEIGKLSAQSAPERIDLQMDNVQMLILNEPSFNGVYYEINSANNGVNIPKGVVSAGEHSSHYISIFILVCTIVSLNQAG